MYSTSRRHRSQIVHRMVEVKVSPVYTLGSSSLILGRVNRLWTKRGQHFLHWQKEKTPGVNSLIALSNLQQL